MITFIIGLVIGAVIGILLFINSLDDFISYIICIGFTISISLLGGLIGILIAFALPAETEMTCVETSQIVNLQDNNSVEGNFFLGTGYIEGEMKYVFYYQIDSTSFKMKQVSFYNAIIKYSDIPKVEKYINKPTDSKINLFALDNEINNYIIYVPKGSIKNNYELDAK